MPAARMPHIPTNAGRGLLILRPAALRGRSALVAVTVAGALALVGCQAVDSAVPGSSGDRGVVGAADGAQDPVADVAGDMPEECVEVTIGWYPGVDIADVDLMPADWPAPPSGSTLCSTSTGGSIQTASYASPLSIDDVFAHYEAGLPDAYTTVRLSGEETGTGYESLEGENGEVGFEIRRNDGGFTLAFQAW